MKLFVITFPSPEICENTCKEGEATKYYLANDIEAVWIKLGRPRVNCYTLKSGESINRVRSTRSRDLGTPNPRFDFEKDMREGNIIRFLVGGLYGVYVNEAPVETI